MELLDVGFHLSWEAGGKVKDGAAPELALLESPHIISSDDTKIVTTATERDEQIRILVLVCVDDLPRRQNNLEICHIIRDEAFSRGEEGETACDGFSKIPERGKMYAECLPERQSPPMPPVLARLPVTASPLS